MKIEDFLKNSYFDGYLEKVTSHVNNIIGETKDEVISKISKTAFIPSAVLDIELHNEEYFVIYKSFNVDIISENYWYRFNNLNGMSDIYAFIDRSSSGTVKQNQDYRDTVSSSLNMYETFCGAKQLPQYQKNLIQEALEIIRQGGEQGHMPKVDFELLEKRIFFITKTVLDNYVFIGPMNCVFELRKSKGLYKLYEVGLAYNKTDAKDAVTKIFEQDKKFAAQHKNMNDSLSKIIKSLKKDKDDDK